MKKLYQSLIAYLIFPILSVFYAFIIIFCITIKQYRVAGQALYIWGRLCFILLNQPYEIVGLENIDPNKRYLVISNHGSVVDITALAIIFRQPLSWVMKESLMKIPIFSLLFKMGLGIPIKRNNAKKSQDEILKRVSLLKNTLNPHILIYPEGTRTKTGDINEFKRGFVKIMKEYEMDVLPVTLSGFYNFFPPKQFFPNPSSKLKITIHPPHSYLELKELDDKEVSKQMQAIIQENYYA